MNIAWKEAPEIDSDAPTKTAAIIRGRRILRRIFSSNWRSIVKVTRALKIFHRKNEHMSLIPTGYLPRTRETSTASTRAAKSDVMTRPVLMGG